MSNITPEDSIKTMLNLVSDGVLALEDITAPLQIWIQQYGPLDETKDYVQRFLNKIRGK